MKQKNICLYGASSDLIDEKYITECERLGELIARRGYGLVFGGGAHGMMGAAARGVTRGGGQITGIAPSFFDVDGLLYDKCNDFVYPDDMRTRKKMLEESSYAFITVPGGIGTYDEFFEILTLKQLGRHNKAIVLFNLYGYFDPLLALIDNTVFCRFAGNETKELFSVCDNAEAALDCIDAYIPGNAVFRKSVAR